LKFFFLTLCTEGRRKILSRINDDATVTLTQAGEAVAEAWRTSHARNPAVTASNFIIMPDHVHLLLIVNYGKAPNFDIIGWIHEFQRLASNDTGRLPRAPQSAIATEKASPENNPTSTELRAATFPKINPTSPGLGAAASPKINPTLAGLGAAAPYHCTGLGAAAFPEINPTSTGLGARAPSPWENKFWLMLSFSSRQLKAFRRYIKLNPARALWKARNPDRFLRRANIRHPILPSGRIWDAVGNLTLLASPLLFPVRLTRKKTPEEHSAAIDEIIAKARQGMIPVSGFISPGEKEALRRLKAEPMARFIKTLPHALPPRYDPSAEDSRELAADRLLILSGFPQTVSAHDKIARTNCLLMNDLIVALCENAQTLK
jgi:hypothetical protein